MAGPLILDSFQFLCLGLHQSPNTCSMKVVYADEVAAFLPFSMQFIKIYTYVTHMMMTVGHAGSHTIRSSAFPS